MYIGGYRGYGKYRVLSTFRTTLELIRMRAVDVLTPAVPRTFLEKSRVSRPYTKR